MTTRLVIDSPAGVEMLLQTPAGRRLLTRLPADREEWVPDLYFAEVASALGHPTVVARFTPARIAAARSRLAESPLRRVPVQPLLIDARRLRVGGTVSAAVYVALARRLGASLVTTDAGVAAGAGVDCILA